MGTVTCLASMPALALVLALAVALSLSCQQSTSSLVATAESCLDKAEKTVSVTSSSASDDRQFKLPVKSPRSGYSMSGLSISLSLSAYKEISACVGQFLLAMLDALSNCSDSGMAGFSSCC